MVCIVAEFGSCIIHISSDLLVLISPRSRNLSLIFVTFVKCFRELSGSLGLREGALWSSIDLLES